MLWSFHALFFPPVTFSLARISPVLVKTDCLGQPSHFNTTFMGKPISVYVVSTNVAGLVAAYDVGCNLGDDCSQYVHNRQNISPK